jgi:hypothetical protein
MGKEVNNYVKTRYPEPVCVGVNVTDDLPAA